MSRRALRSESAEQTEAIGADLAARLRPGDVVLVGGELGAGKSTFVRGACRALGVREPVTSPTFTIGRSYEGKVGVSHLDLYRLEDLADEDPGLLDDYLTPDRVGFVEWPGEGRGASLLDGARVAARVQVAHAGGDSREITIAGSVLA
ncbi:MAG: tRNA (adenosine(37)-N6)-threonylcarbamoyltransferase complex ATPase subunit type 1 TsaE [Solirubrobacterales bacterium]|nr:tRNA (adenosine(37)-N6)-threonylcarbamoyltransferase complex ATPase subunit type 1 TsaE [Solirubrobacterales bacterium]